MKNKKIIALAITPFIAMIANGCSKNINNYEGISNSTIYEQYEDIDSDDIIIEELSTTEDNTEITTEEKTEVITEPTTKAYVYEDKLLYNTSNLNLRETDDVNSEIITVIDKCNKFNLIKTNGTWDYIEYDGIEGYVSSKYTNELSSTHVVIDISDQKVYLFKDDELILEDDVVTGRKDKYDTRIGCHAIYSKERNRYLTGNDYKVYVEYWMPFDGGQGLHDASWRSNFGGENYINNGSHGCVNMSASSAETIYNNVEVNKTMVLVHK